jgi:acetyltransferase
VTLSDIFHPESIAVVGASREEGKLGYAAMANVRDFDGPVYPVNPSGEGELFGQEFVASVADVDADLALLCVPAHVVPDVVEECGQAGVGAAVVYAGGFAEAGDDGEELQARAVAAAADHDVVLLGPNTSGFARPAEGLFGSFVPGVTEIEAGNVAVLAQSGGIAHAVAFHAQREGRGLSAMVGLGNRANTGFEEFVEYLDDDPETEAIVLHVEGVDDARSLVQTCRAVETPVVTFKVGRADVGGFAESHTGALTGDHKLYTAAFHQYGVPTVDSTTQLLDAGYALANSPEPTGTNVALVTAQAGPGIAITDRLKQAGATLPELSEATQDAIADRLPGITYTDNPVDTARPSPAFGDIVEIVARDENVDVVLVYELHEEGLGYPTETLDGLDEAVDKPILFATGGLESLLEADRAALESAGVPTYDTPERGADAAAALVQYAEHNEPSGSASSGPGGASR